MENISLNDLIGMLTEYNPEEVKIVKRAYEYADDLHKGQFRQSGWPYISHPPNVAYILAELHANWDVMQDDLKQRFQFFKSLTEINSMFGDNQQFVNQVKTELFAVIVYVYTTKGDIIELPKGATPIDFAYKIHTDIGVDYVLQNKDRIKIITDELSYGPRDIG